MVLDMKVTTKKERSMERVNSTLQMEAFIMENFKTMKFQVMENTNGMMERFTMVNG